MTDSPGSLWADSKQRSTLLLFMLAAFVLRAAYALFIAPQELIFPDEQTYLTYAKAWLGMEPLPEGYKQAFVMPVYPLVVGALTWLGQGGFWLVRLVQAAVSALTLAPVAIIAYRLHPSRLTVIAACLAMTLYPFFIFYTSLLLTETLFLFVVALFFQMLLQPELKRKGLLSGVVAGFGHLLRPVFMLFLPVAWAWQLLFKRARVSQVLICALVFAVLAATWAVRNYEVLGEPLLTTTTSGRTLYEGNNPMSVDGGVCPEGFSPTRGMPEGLNEIEVNQWQKEQAVAYIKENPGRFLTLCWKRFLRFWNPIPNAEQYSSGLYAWLSILSFGPVLILALLSIWVLRRQWKSTVVIWLFIGYVTALHMVTIASIRYRLPLEPLLIALAAACLGK
ncbi:MAG: hypothetical protein D6E12_11520, partial [Desulfovibrio sp.]